MNHHWLPDVCRRQHCVARIIVGIIGNVSGSSSGKAYYSPRMTCESLASLTISSASQATLRCAIKTTHFIRLSTDARRGKRGFDLNLNGEW